MTTLHGWPFPVEIVGDVRSGAPAQLLVQTAKPFDAPTLERLHLCIQTFAELACCGGLSGDKLPPTSSWAKLVSEQRPEVSGGDLVWRFISIAIDPRGLPVLLNMLEGAESDIQMVRLSTNGPDAVPQLAVDDYPALTAALPFQLDYDLTSRNLDVEVVFPALPVPEIHERIIDPLLTWRLAVILGGFRTADLQPLESNFLPLDDPEIVLDALTFGCEKNTAHAGALDSLVNVLVWVCQVVTSVEQVSIL